MTICTPEMRERALRMRVEARPDRPNRMAAVRQVAGLSGMSPGTLRVLRRRYEVDADRRPGVVGDGGDLPLDGVQHPVELGVNTVRVLFDRAGRAHFGPHRTLVAALRGATAAPGDREKARPS
jgi:hypothetical protein